MTHWWQLHSQSYASRLKTVCASGCEGVPHLFERPRGALAEATFGGYFLTFVLLLGEYLLLDEDTCPSSRRSMRSKARLELSLIRPPFARNSVTAFCARLCCFGFALPYACRSEVRQKSSRADPVECSSCMNCSTFS